MPSRMCDVDRMEAYSRQRGGGSLTAKQMRRARKKDKRIRAHGFHYERQTKQVVDA